MKELVGGVRLRPLEASDAPRLHALEHDPAVAQGLIHAPPTLEAVAARVGAGASADADAVWYQVIEAGGEVAGQLELRLIQAEGLTCGSFEVYVAPALQGRGIGRAVVSEAPALIASRWGVDVVLIGVFEDNASARRLYAGLGYAEVDRQWYWPEQGERRRMLLLSNRPERFRRPAGFRRPGGGDQAS